MKTKFISVDELAAKETRKEERFANQQLKETLIQMPYPYAIVH